MERILIVEDSATQREMLRHIVDSNGYKAATAIDGADAWSRLAEIAPTIVVTDILMPRMDGYSLCRAIKREPAFSAIPVVLLTALSDPKDVIAALECGADGFIGKPFADEYFLSRLRSVITNRELAGRDVREEDGVEIDYEGRAHRITARPRQILDLLLSVYEVALRRNSDLALAQASLRALNAELEQKVQDRTRRFEESNRSLETFCYSVAHDLRAPLRSIQGYLAILEEGSAPPEVSTRVYTERARTAAARMDRMIVDLLAYGRVSHSEPEMERVDVRAEIQRTVGEFAEDIAAKGAKVSVSVTGTDAHIWTSRVLLVQVLGNLLGNALKFVRDGEAPAVEIAIGAMPQGVRIDVKDRGIGIDLAYREKIFRVFEKAHAEPFPGTGIGLAIVHKAVERLGGHISVESEPGKGSCFSVELPSGSGG